MYVLKVLLFTRNGYYTVEASLLFTLVFFAILTLIFTGIFIYQQVMLHNYAEAIVWNFCKGENCSSDIFWRFDLDLQNKVKEYAIPIIENAKIRNLEFSKQGNIQVNVEITPESLLNKRIKVTLTTLIKNPLGGILGIFGISSNLECTGEAFGKLNVPVDFVRTMDYAKTQVNEVYSIQNQSGKSLRELLSEQFTKTQATISFIMK